MTESQVHVSPSLVKGWSHPAVQRLRHALEGDDMSLVGVVEDVVLNGSWMKTFLPFPYLADSPEAVRLEAALKEVKERHLDRAVAQSFSFKFFKVRESMDGLPPIHEGVQVYLEKWPPYEVAVLASMTLSADEAEMWPRQWS